MNDDYINGSVIEIYNDNNVTLRSTYIDHIKKGATMNKVIDPKSNIIFNVEKVKNNLIPKHFFLAEKKLIKINGAKVEVMMNKERTQYVAFVIGDQSYYVRNHSFFAGDNYVEVVKPVAPAPTVKVVKVEEVTS